MNNTLKNILIFGGGLAVGALIGVMVTKTKYELILEEEIASVKETFERKRKKISEAVEEINGEISASVHQEERTVRKGKLNRHYAEMIRNNQYDPADREAPTEDDEDYRKWERVTEDTNTRELHGEPYVITFEQFNEEMDHYDKLTITYYQNDDTLADDNEEIISDTFALVGSNALVSFGLGSEDPDIVYIRNERLQIDYEIVRMDKSFSETVLGMVGDE